MSQPYTYFEPGELWRDDHGVHLNAHGGGILLHDGRYYWHGEHKIAGTAGNSAHVGVHVYSSADLLNWKDEGIALAVSPDPESDIGAGCIVERPKVLFNALTGKFVMWFHLELKSWGYGSARCGVAVADRPEGPFQFMESFRPNAGVWPLNMADGDRRPLSPAEFAQLKQLNLNGGAVPNYPENLIYRRDFATGQMSRDMTLFQDDDGTAYHVHSAEDNGVLHISQLSPDYLRPAGIYRRYFAGEFNEAPVILKRRGRYYLVSSGCTGWDPNPARSYVADSIWGPWTPLGNPCAGTPEEVETTFHSQGTFLLPAPGKPDAFIFMADRWRPNDAIDGRYVWLPVEFEGERLVLRWRERWSLDEMNSPGI